MATSRIKRVMSMGEVNQLVINWFWCWEGFTRATAMERLCYSIGWNNWTRFESTYRSYI